MRPSKREPGGWKEEEGGRKEERDEGDEGDDRGWGSRRRTRERVRGGRE